MEPGLRRDELTLRGALSELVPAGVASAVAAVSSDHGLIGDESVLIARAVESRRCEFAAGRRCARDALRAVGGPAVAIGRGPMGEPRFPDAFAGAITHGSRFAAAIAYPAFDLTADHAVDLVDERDLGVFVEIAPTVIGDVERYLYGARATDAMLLAGVFSAKEAAIKILSPRLERYVDFKELRAVSVGVGDEFLVTGPDGQRVSSRSRFVGDVLLTVASSCLPQPRRSCAGV